MSSLTVPKRTKALSSLKADTNKSKGEISNNINLYRQTSIFEGVSQKDQKIIILTPLGDSHKFLKIDEAYSV